MKLKKWLVWIMCLGLMASFAQAATQEEQLELAATYNDQVKQFYQQGQFNNALPLAEKVFKIMTEILGEKHPNTLASLSNLATIYKVLGYLDDALLLYENSYRLHKEILGEKHPQTLANMNNLALIYKDLGRLDEALPLSEKSYRLCKDVFGEKHRNTLLVLNNLARVYQDLGRLEEALSLLENGYPLFKEVLGEKHPDTLTSLNNLARIYQDLGRLNESLPLLENCYYLRKDVLGEKHPDTLTSLNNLARIYQDLGRLDEALPLLENGYYLHKEVLGKKHPDTLLSLNNLASIYSDLGRLDDALFLYEKGYQLFKDVLGNKHPRTLVSMNNLAEIYNALGRLDEALPCLKNCYHLRKEVLGEKHPNTLVSMNNLAGIYNALGRLDDALPLLKRGYHIRKGFLGEKHPDTLVSMSNLAFIYNSLGHLDDALLLYENSYRLRKEVLGEKHPDTLLNLKNLAYAYVEQGHIEKAIKHLEQLIKGVEELRKRGELSAENRQALFKQWIDGYFALSYLYLIKARPNEAFHTSEKTKARTLLESMAMKLAVQNALSEADQQKFQNYQTSLTYLNHKIAIKLAMEKKLEQEIIRESTVEKKRRLTIARESATEKKLVLGREKNQLVKEAAGFHRTLRQENPTYAQLNDFQIVTAETGASLIPEDTLFISYLTQGNRVLVFTLDSTGNLQAKDLGEIPKLDQTLKTYHEWLSKRCDTLGAFKCEGKDVWKKPDGSLAVSHETPDYATEGDEVELDDFIRYLNNMSRELAQKLLAPIKERLQNKKRLIISPDGALALIPFETLILDEQAVIATHQVSYVQSLSVLKLLKKRENEYQSIKNRGTLLAMGAAPYQVGNEKRASPKIDIETMLTRSHDQQRYQYAFRAKGKTWDNLPHSETELMALKDIFSDKQPLIYKGADASEAQLQKMNENKKLANYQYIVFSAHGHLDMEVPALSAIVLDQINKTEGSDGYVTASEWPSYDLRSDLMVLSACQTGVGKIMQGEGVMGLPYAFYVAGNKNTLMTLWSVEDKSTAEFITRFFTKLKGGQSQIEALTATKREFLEDEELEDYTLPLFWAPFVLYGI